MPSEYEKNVRPAKAWSLLWGGDWRFGDYSISVDKSGVARLVLFDTANRDDASGAGVVEGRDGQYDKNAVIEIQQALCDASNQTGRGLSVAPTDAPATFSASCDYDGVTQDRRGHIALLPEEIFKKVSENARLVHLSLLQSGVKKIWINAGVERIVRSKDRFLVTVRFKNYGRVAISFKRPDLWSGSFREETLSIGAINQDPAGRGGWEFELAGQRLENISEFQGDLVTLEAGEYRDFVFNVTPKDKYKSGTYEFSLDSWLYVDWVDEDERQHSHVDFYSGAKNRKVITIDHDYPSTPQEREQWEATHRTSMSSHTVKPGERFEEDGLYRAVRLTSGGYRSLQLTQFKAGDVATTADVKMPMESGHGIDINGPVQWIWEGSAPIRTSDYSTEYVDGTQQVSAPGAPCPRGGRWVARIRLEDAGYVPQYRYDTAQIVMMRRDQKMPSIQTNARDADWEWVGV